MKKKQCINFKKLKKIILLLIDSIRSESELSSRKNIYDNDEFDVFAKNKIDLSKVYLGKK